MDGGSTGGAAGGDEKPPTQGFASRLTSLYENLVKKKDKGAPVPVDEEAPKVRSKVLLCLCSQQLLFKFFFKF